MQENSHNSDSRYGSLNHPSLALLFLTLTDFCGNRIWLFIILCAQTVEAICYLWLKWMAPVKSLKLFSSEGNHPLGGKKKCYRI